MTKLANIWPQHAPQCWTVTLQLQAPVLTHGLSTLAFGVDAAMQIYHERPVINGSLLRGLVRHQWCAFLALLAEQAKQAPYPLSKEKIDCWLGAPSQDGEWAPRPAQVQFDYFWRDDETSPKAHFRHRIRIDENTGTVAPGALMSLSTPYQAGEQARFSGKVYTWLNEEEAKGFEYWLTKALHSLPAVGALKSNGFGRVLAVTIAPSPVQLDHRLTTEDTGSSQANTTRADKDALLQGSRWQGLLSFDRPVCVAAPHLPDDNRFIGEAAIPGQVLKGALARRLRLAMADQGLDEASQSQALQAWDFDAWQFSFAQPAEQGQRPLPLPFSLAWFTPISDAAETDQTTKKDPQLLDLALCSKPGLLRINGTLLAPRFQPDWKDSDYAAKLDTAVKLKGPSYPRAPEVSRYLVVRTAVNRERGSAADAQLFSLECIDPIKSAPPGEKTEPDAKLEQQYWHFILDLGHTRLNAEERAQVREQLARLGFSHIGKTKANAPLQWCDTPLTEAEPDLTQTPIVLMLCSPARILPQNIYQDKFPPSDNHAALHAAYAEYFHQASAGSLVLSHFFARQELAGNHFYHHYYRARHVSNASFSPEWLTEPGSVFVFTIAADGHKQATECLKDWQRYGLPCAADRADEDWRSDPYRREHGYGEVVINHPIHRQMQANQGEWHELTD